MVCRYLNEPGAKIRKRCWEAAARRAEELGIGKVLVVPCSGKTAFTALKVFEQRLKSLPSRMLPFCETGLSELSERDARGAGGKGVTVLTASMLSAG